ncbi:hypothetical protein CDL15_Pgr018237 [Punica granatum]|uniref:Uncharacterized protein n=1 Tax=Punica granatum TaxID=22663 RepID=A0A218WJY9_PUNGR|nr:hypothetical protein CDL15_Pgr018237 [Punica granatum]
MAEFVSIFFDIIAFLCTAGAIGLALWHIYMHLVNYTEPTYQRYIVRIIFMVPLLVAIFDRYEAWVIYNFLSLCLAWVGGPGAVVLSLSGRIMKPSWLLMTCCLPPISLDGRFIRRCKQGCLQFVILKPILGVLVFLAAKSRLIKDADEAARFQDFIICVEMLIAALGHLYAFPYKEYASANIGGSPGFTKSLAHALMLNDFYHDTVHQFAPTYHEYVLYNHGDGDEGTRKYRSRTFVPTGQEMDAVRRNKHMLGSKGDEIQLSSLSSSATSTPKASTTAPNSETMKSSLLVDISSSSSVPYDMSLIDLDYSPKASPANETGKR